MGQKFIAIRFNMYLPAVIVKKEKWYVAKCPVLDVSSQGATEEEARKNLTEALAAFMISCHERGVLDTVLKNCGFVPDYSGKHAVSPVDNPDYINVPLPFMIDMNDPHRCHA